MAGRLLSMTSVMSATGEPAYGRSSPNALAVLMAPPASSRDEYVEFDGMGHDYPAAVWDRWVSVWSSFARGVA